jgi:multidrug efflux pump subunit AcrA (membrane-fusion protein)
MTGTVSAISPVSATSDGSVVSYPVTIRIDEPPVDIRSGMTADVTITTASVDDVLTIPSEALGGSDGDYTVRVLDATGTPEARPVEVGLVTETLAEIAAGLAVGETVVTGTVTDRDATTTDPTNLRGNFPAGGGGAIPGGNFGGGVRP